MGKIQKPAFPSLIKKGEVSDFLIKERIISAVIAGACDRESISLCAGIELDLYDYMCSAYPDLEKELKVRSEDLFLKSMEVVREEIVTHKNADLAFKIVKTLKERYRETTNLNTTINQIPNVEVNFISTPQRTLENKDVKPAFKPIPAAKPGKSKD